MARAVAMLLLFTALLGCREPPAYTYHRQCFSAGQLVWEDRGQAAPGKPAPAIKWVGEGHVQMPDGRVMKAQCIGHLYSEDGSLVSTRKMTE